jgi:hypothetical protein
VSAAGLRLNGRVAHLERVTGHAGECPRHDTVIGIRSIQDGVTTVTSEPAQHSCRWCGQPPSEVRFVIETVPDRRPEDLDR